MSNLIFITKNDSENFETVYYAIEESKIETLNVSDTYDKNGQKIDSQDAGDYVKLLSEKAVKTANDVYNEPYTYEDDFEYNKYFSINDGFSAYDNRQAYDEVSKLKEGIDIEFTKTTCEGFNYWNGHNWKTITTSCEYGEPTHSIVTDSELIEILNNAIENKEYVKEGFGQKIYTFEDITIINNYCQGSFSTYEITL